MENLIEIKSEYNSLDTLYAFLKNDPLYEYSKTYDIWELRTDANGQAKQCIVMKKSGMHAIKIFFANEKTVKINYMIPNKIMHMYFAKSVKRHRSILEIVAGVIKQAVLDRPQKKAFSELEQHFIKLAA